jgi:hypothetical protein
LESINKYSPVKKVIKVSTTYDGESLIEVPTLFGLQVIKLSGTVADLRNTAGILNTLGILDSVDTPKRVQEFIDKCVFLGVVIYQLELEYGKSLDFSTTTTMHPPKYENEEEQLSIFFQLNITSVNDVPILLTELIESMTEFLIMFNHRIIDTGRCLN